MNSFIFGYSPVGLFVRQLLEDNEFSSQVAYHKILPEKEAQGGELAKPLPAAISRLLTKREISLYTHQALAINYIRSGKSLIVSTPTASGKSLIYNLPVLESKLDDPDATALYLFPLKALAQDQLASLKKLYSSWPEETKPSAHLYDGDTTIPERNEIRKNNPKILFTNPEMLNLAILPYHEKWTSFIAGLTHIIVDEAHIYRGIFGCHMAQIFRRLNRLCARYGAVPQYIFCTATLGNPLELCSTLMDAQPENQPVAILESGAPQGKRHFLFVNPLQSSSTCAITLLKKALQNNLRTIIYCSSRKMTELIYLWTTESGEYSKESISSYRAGFLPEERREIERKMASGELKAVISTSALELGIDIGGLDLCILVGYPGTIMQTLQRGGRVGRALQESAVILIAGEDALDQYFIAHPQEFFSRPFEKAVVNPDNENILASHLICAASESPLSPMESWLQKPAVQKLIPLLADLGKLQKTDNGEWVTPDPNPQRKLDIRGSGDNYVIEDDSGNPVGMMDGLRVWKETHTGAIYLHHGRSYLIESVDSGKKRIIAKESRVNWFTRSRGHKSTDILEEFERKIIGNCVACMGRLRVSEFITGYEKRSNQGQKLLAVTPLNAPPYIFETEGIWLVFPEQIRKSLESRFLHFMGSIHALEHAAIGLMPLVVMADRNDFGGISVPLHPQLGYASVFIYDSIPGGAGLCKSAYSSIAHLLNAVLSSIQRCPCDDGCPSCIHSPKCGAGNRPLSKAGAIELLKNLLEDSGLGEELENSLVISPAPDRLMQVLKKDRKNNKEKLPDNEHKPDNKKYDAKAENFFEKLARNGNFSKSAPNSKVYPKSAPEKFVVFDVETRRSAKEVGGWNNADKMGISVAVLYENINNSFTAFEQEELDLFFQKLADADLVIGFNSFRFDYAVLNPFVEISSMHHLPRLNTLPGLDLMQCILNSSGIRISLDNLCQATLHSKKSASGLQALQWWRTGEMEKIKSYCQKDVQLTRDLYLHGLNTGEVFYTNKAGKLVRIPVDFSGTPRLR